ncbi:ABC-type glycerol-3-phosphate transport system permease component [Bradyrhizobium sp. GM0.4]
MRERTIAPSRILIYLVVSLIAAAWLAPLVVVVLNSLRTNEEIAQASMIGWPKQWAWSNYAAAWSGFCVAETCAGIRPYMLNSRARHDPRDDFLDPARCCRRLRRVALAFSRR